MRKEPKEFKGADTPELPEDRKYAFFKNNSIMFEVKEGGRDIANEDWEPDFYLREEEKEASVSSNAPNGHSPR